MCQSTALEVSKLADTKVLVNVSFNQKRKENQYLSRWVFHWDGFLLWNSEVCVSVVLTTGDAQGQARCIESFHIVSRLLMVVSHITVWSLLFTSRSSRKSLMSWDWLGWGADRRSLQQCVGCSERWCVRPLEPAYIESPSLASDLSLEYAPFLKCAYDSE